MKWLTEFVRFSRLHTVVGTTLSIVVLYVLAQAAAGAPGEGLKLLGWTLLSCLGANIYIVGLNQITDIEIDRINKPYLPLASGAFSLRTAYWIVLTALAVSLAVAIWLGGFLLLTVILSLLLGTAYSLPPFRLKRFYFWAAFCIIAVRGLIVNLLIYLHFSLGLGGDDAIQPMVWWLTFTIFIYSLVIAWYKDMPDTKGDERYSIRTLSVRWGVRKVFLGGVALLVGTYVGLILLPLLTATPLHEGILAVAHGLFLILLLAASRRVKLQEPASVFQYYQFIWVLYFLEYLAFGMAGWWA